MSDISRAVEAARERKNSEAQRQEHFRRESRERVASFIGLMAANNVRPVAVYRETEHAVMREEGVFRKRQVDTGQKRYTHTPIGHGWPITEAGNDSDWDRRIMTIMDTGETYQTNYPQTHRYPDTPEVPYVVTRSDNDGPFDYVPMFTGEDGEQKLAYAAIRLMGE